MPPHERSLRTPFFVCLAAIAVLGIGIWRDAWPWIADDTFISLRFAERLLAGHGLTWTDGERVEGYSNLLWVLLTAGLGALGCDWVAAVRGLGIGCMIGTFAVLAFGGLLPARPPALLAVLLLAAQTSVSTWAIGGLEVPLVMLLLAATMVLVTRALRHPVAPSRRCLLGAGLALALLAWTRPDGPLWAVVAGTTVFLFGRTGPTEVPRRRSWSLLVPLLVPTLAAVLLQLGFRLAYYGDWLPNTGRAKVSPSAGSLAAGADYLASSIRAHRALLVPAVLGAMLGLRRREHRPLLAMAMLGAVLWSLYLLQVGGDVFPRSRLVLPALVPLTVLAAHGLAALAKFGRVGRIAAWVVAVGSIALTRIDAARPTADVHQQLSTWEWGAVETGEWLRRAFRPEASQIAGRAPSSPLLAVDAAGAVPFMSRLPCLDMLGLCDRTIATTPPAADRGFIVGHNRGNGAYVLSRRPDLIMFGEPPGAPQPRFLSGVQMEAEPQFLADYRVVLFHTVAVERGDGPPRNLRLTMWVRLTGVVGIPALDPSLSPSLGPSMGPSMGPSLDRGTKDWGTQQVHVPGYLLASYRQLYSFGALAKRTGADGPGLEQLQHDVAEGARWWLDAAVVGVLDSERVIGQVRRAGRHRVSGVPLPIGLYTVKSDSLPASITVQMTDASGTELPLRDGAWVVAATATERPLVDIICVVPDTVTLPLSIAEIELQRRN
ncbi:MAG: hypothetical protein ABIP94_18665 [Planctomycetota bacterium]